MNNQQMKEEDSSNKSTEVVNESTDQKKELSLQELFQKSAEIIETEINPCFETYKPKIDQNNKHEKPVENEFAIEQKAFFRAAGAKAVILKSLEKKIVLPTFLKTYNEGFVEFSKKGFNLVILKLKDILKDYKESVDEREYWKATNWVNWTNQYKYPFEKPLQKIITELESLYKNTEEKVSNVEKSEENSLQLVSTTNANTQSSGNEIMDFMKKGFEQLTLGQEELKKEVSSLKEENKNLTKELQETKKELQDNKLALVLQKNEYNELQKQFHSINLNVTMNKKNPHINEAPKTFKDNHVSSEYIVGSFEKIIKTKIFKSTYAEKIKVEDLGFNYRDTSVNKEQAKNYEIWKLSRAVSANTWFAIRILENYYSELKKVPDQRLGTLFNPKQEMFFVLELIKLLISKSFEVRNDRVQTVWDEFISRCETEVIKEEKISDALKNILSDIKSLPENDVLPSSERSKCIDYALTIFSKDHKNAEVFLPADEKFYNYLDTTCRNISNNSFQK